MRKDITAALTKAAIGHWTKKNYFVMQEMAITKRGRLRADVVAMHIRREIIICEIKSSWEDYKTDNKWTKYLKEECFTRFYFVITQDLYEDKRCKTMLADIREHSVGLMVLSRNTGLLRTVIKCKKRSVSEAQMLNIALRILYRNSLNKSNTRRIRQYL